MSIFSIVLTTNLFENRFQNVYETKTSQNYETNTLKTPGNLLLNSSTYRKVSIFFNIQSRHLIKSTTNLKTLNETRKKREVRELNKI